ncbi:protein of unknown function [Paraburkholderia kururiensis]
MAARRLDISFSRGHGAFLLHFPALRSADTWFHFPLPQSNLNGTSARHDFSTVSLVPTAPDRSAAPGANGLCICVALGRRPWS